MKTVRLLMFLLGLFLFSSFVNEESVIRLTQVMLPSRRSISIQPYVQAYLSDRTVEVRFLQKIGNVQVQILSSCGDIICDQICNTSNRTSYFIEISPEEIGNEDSYTITITASEEVLEGEFYL